MSALGISVYLVARPATITRRVQPCGFSTPLTYRQGVCLALGNRILLVVRSPRRNR